MTPEFTPMDAVLEQAVAEIRDEQVDSAVIEAASARVWARLSEAAAATRVNGSTIRSCADFQALIPELRAGKLSEARAMLLRDHLHQCVACRHAFEGKVVAIPAPTVVRANRHAGRWAMAATVLLVAGVTVWWAENQYGQRTGHAVVQSIDGSLYVVAADGLHPLLKGQALPADSELRTAKDSDAVLELTDGSKVEVRERSSLSTSASGSDLTIRLASGSVIVQAAHRSQGHLFVDTGDCRVAVTGTLFGVTAGMKGSRVSVLQGEVHVTQDNQEKILHAGDQTVTSANVEPEAVSTDIAWSHNRVELLKQLKSTLALVHQPALRYESRLLAHLPANTTLFISIPNLAQYMADAESVLSQRMGLDSQLRSLWTPQMSEAMEKVRAGSEYLGDEIDIVESEGKVPVIVAEQRKEGFEEFLHTKGLPFKVVNHAGILLFGPDNGSVDSTAAQLDSGFADKPFYARIAASYREGAGLLLWKELPAGPSPVSGARYFSLEEKQAGKEMVASAALGFDGPRTGMAGELADPSPIGSLDYISPEAVAVLGFVVKDPGAIVDSALSITQGSWSAARQTLSDEHQEKGFNVRDEFAASLGGEFAIAMDGPIMPVPSWKLVTEVYDPGRFQAALQHFVDAHNQAAHTGNKPIIVTGKEVVDGRTYYSIAQADSGPIMEAHYTFDRGYLVAGPTRALVAQALRLNTAGTSIRHSSKFLEMTPRDRHLNFSAVIYQNLGDSLAPLAMLAGSMAPQGDSRRGNPLQGLTHVKPTLYAVYAEPDRIAMTANGEVIGSTLDNLLNGNIMGMTGLRLPFGQKMGTREPQPAYSHR